MILVDTSEEVPPPTPSTPCTLSSFRRRLLNIRKNILEGKIERYHRSMKNILLLENYYSPGESTEQTDLLIEYYNNHRYHSASNNLTPADVYYGKGREILTRRERIKKNTMLQRRRYNCALKVA
ncbi:MAG: integrase core domain-containing protein [Desulfobacterales bacterium]|nr:integrase core domain-containing protein [Desulfobacterales bacterium]MDP6681448.1 integrase core domain-containing protein [Desulfobacterales bacterium]